MSDTPKDWLDRVYESQTLDELEESYDGWPSGYEADLLTSGYRLPAVENGLAGRHPPADTAPILGGLWHGLHRRSSIPFHAATRPTVWWSSLGISIAIA